MADLSEALAAGEAGSPLQTPAASPLAEPAPLSFGEALKAERERRALTREYVAARLHLPLRQFDALEALQLDAFPPGPYLRGFVRNYAKEVGLDPAPLLADLEKRVQPAPAPLAMDSKAQPPATLVIDRGRWPGQVVIWGGALALGVFALIGLLVSRTPPQQIAPPAAVTIVETPAAAPPPNAEAAASAPASAVAAETSAVVPSAPVVEVAPPPPPDLRIVIGSRPSWVEVVQADGSVVVSGLQPAGAELELSGTRPLKLVIGNATGVTVEAQGQAVALAPHLQSDVVRLTIP
jgi:cytoskeleton protein RodZ